MFFRKSIPFFVLLATLSSFAGQIKPRIKIAIDSFPTGQETPEGVASDFARVFINKDILALQRIALRPYGQGPSRTEYIRLLNGLYASLSRDKASGIKDPQNPSKIFRVFAARHLSSAGPSSYGYAAFGFKDVMFVDVEVFLNNGTRYTDRTMVVRDADGKWYVDVAPYVSSILSNGLDQESTSNQTFSQVYDPTK